jgi:hypothetical protein
MFTHPRPERTEDILTANLAGNNMDEHMESCWDEFEEDGIKVQYWNNDAVDDPIYALQLHEETWSIIDMKTILEWGL